MTTTCLAPPAQHHTGHIALQQTPSAPARHPLLDQLASVGEAVAADGPVAHERAIADLVRRARDAGVDSLSLDIVADLTAPPVVRCRALARLASVFECLPHPRGGRTTRLHPETLD